jgi:hypothetical protein
VNSPLQCARASRAPADKGPIETPSNHALISMAQDKASVEELLLEPSADIDCTGLLPVGPGACTPSGHAPEGRSSTQAAMRGPRSWPGRSAWLHGSCARLCILEQLSDGHATERVRACVAWPHAGGHRQRAPRHPRLLQLLPPREAAAGDGERRRSVQPGPRAGRAGAAPARQPPAAGGWRYPPTPFHPSPPDTCCARARRRAWRRTWAATTC